MIRRSFAPLMGLAMLVVMSSASNAHAFEILNNLIYGCDGAPSCCEAPSCGRQRAQRCCQPRCQRERCHHHRNRCCKPACDAVCGAPVCDAAPVCGDIAPACGCAPKCCRQPRCRHWHLGMHLNRCCDAVRAACAPNCCGPAPACGCAG